MSMEYRIPHPKDRRTYGAYATPDEAKAAGHEIIRLLNGIPFGFRMAIYERMGAFVLISCPSEAGQ